MVTQPPRHGLMVWVGFGLEDRSRPEVDSSISVPSYEFQDMQKCKIQLVGHRVDMD